MFGLKIDRQSRVIIAAYGIFCVGLLITCLFAIRQTHRILDSAENLYAHPFTVSNKALEARLTARAIRSEILVALLSRDTREVRQVQAHILARDAEFAAAMATVRSFYLGDLGEVDRIEQLYAAWQPKRDALLVMASHGDFDQARTLVFTSGTPRYHELDAELDKVIAFARDRAVNFLQETHARQVQAERVIYLVMLGGFAASFLCSAVVIRRVRDLVRSTEDTLELLAHHDSLTGLPNRQLFADRFGQALRQAEREGKIAAIMYVDLDRFKAVNDTYGHKAGDQLLVHVSAGFAAAVRRSDTVARMGGDEFVILLLAPRNEEALRRVAEKIILVASTPCTFQGHPLEVSASVGIAVFPSDGRDAQTLLNYADKAMYQAKMAGRNQFRFYAEAEPT